MIECIEHFYTGLAVGVSVIPAGIVIGFVLTKVWENSK